MTDKPMGKFDFETLHEFLADRYTPEEFVEKFNIPMEVLVDCLYDFIIDNRIEILQEVTEEV